MGEGATSTSLGQLLLDAGLVDRKQLDRALAAQRDTGSRLGAILVATGAVRRLDLYRVLARQWGYPYLDLTTVELDRDLLGRYDPMVLLREGWVPTGRDPGGRIVAATAEQPTAERIATIEAALGEPASIAVTTDWDIDQALQRGYRVHLLDEAALGLWHRSAVQSARRVVLPGQATILAV